MAHRTFFSFHYERDVWRSSVVRMSNQISSGDKTWIEASLWEATKLRGEGAVQRLINDGLRNTSVTAVLIGAQTASRKWVQYEIDESLKRGNGLFGIYIHNISDSSRARDYKGVNPLPAGYKVYDWVNDNGYLNLGSWVDAAYDQAH